MYNSLQQHYLVRYASYLQKVRIVQEQIVLIFELKSDLSDKDYTIIQHTLMQVLAHCGLMSDPQNLFEEIVHMKQPDKDQLISFIDKTIQVLNTHCDRAVDASSEIVTSKRKKGVYLAPSFPGEKIW